MPQVDWLSQLLQTISVTGKLAACCSYGAPWRASWGTSETHEIPYHVVLEGRAVIEDTVQGTSRELARGDIVLLPHGAAHVLHDGSGNVPLETCDRRGSAGWVVSENRGTGDRVDMLCGHFFIEPPHDRLIRSYLPIDIVVRADDVPMADGSSTASSHLSRLLSLMRMEAIEDRPGGCAILDALASALFTLTLRAANESGQAPSGLLALASHPRLAPAISAMFADPARPWNLPDLANLCSMSRATFMRRFHDTLGRSAMDLLLDIRMNQAAHELTKSMTSTEKVAESVGYQSVAAFRRAFTEKMGVAPGKWRRLSMGETVE